MKAKIPKSTIITQSLLSLSVGCALACLPLGQVSAQEPTPEAMPTGTPSASAAATDTSAAAPATTESSKLSKKEMEFVKKAGAGNAAEVKAGELAGTNGESQDVKDFGAKMVKDHGDANTDLGAIATADKIEFPPSPTDKQKAEYDKLSKLHGAEFDKAYVKAMLANHEKDLAEYKMEKGEAKNPDLKAYVDKTEAVVADHLKMIKDIHAKMMPVEKKS